MRILQNCIKIPFSERGCRQLNFVDQGLPLWYKRPMKKVFGQLICALLVFQFFTFALCEAGELSPVEEKLHSYHILRRGAIDQQRYLLSQINRDLRERAVPNCIECSIFLLDGSRKLSLEKQLLAAEYAHLISPDHPESAFHRAIHTVRRNPLDAAALFRVFRDAANSVLSGIEKNLFLRYFSGKGLLFFAVVLSLLLFQLFLIRRDIVKHLLSHLFEGSRFYRLVLLVFCFGLFLLFCRLNFAVPGTIMLLAVTLFPALSIFERVLVFISASMLLVATFFQIALNPGFERVELRKADFFTNPLFSEMGKDDPVEAGLFHLYNGNYEDALGYLKNIPKDDIAQELVPMFRNMEALSLHHLGRRHEARQVFTDLLKHSRDQRIGINLRRMDVNGGIEEFSITDSSEGESLFPLIVYPRPSKLLDSISGERKDIYGSDFSIFVFTLAIFSLLWIFLWIRYLRGVKVQRCLVCGKISCNRCETFSADGMCLECALFSGKSVESEKGSLPDNEGILPAAALLFLGWWPIGRGKTCFGFFLLLIFSFGLVVLVASLDFGSLFVVPPNLTIFSAAGILIASMPVILQIILSRRNV